MKKQLHFDFHNPRSKHSNPTESKRNSYSIIPSVYFPVSFQNQSSRERSAESVGPKENVPGRSELITLPLITSWREIIRVISAFRFVSEWDMVTLASISLFAAIRDATIDGGPKLHYCRDSPVCRRLTKIVHLLSFLFIFSERGRFNDICRLNCYPTVYFLNVKLNVFVFD